MRQRRKRRALSAQRYIHRAEIRNDRYTGQRRNHRRFAQLQSRRDCSARRVPGGQMKKGVAVRADEAQFRERHARAPSHVERGVAQGPSQAKIQLGDLAGTRPVGSAGREQAAAEPAGVRIGFECEQFDRWPPMLIDPHQGGADTVVRSAGHQADGQMGTAANPQCDLLHRSGRGAS